VPRILSWFNPPPFDAPICYPRQIPKVVVPSFIGDVGQVLNLLMHEGAGNVVKDYSPYKNHGTIYGAKWIDGFGWVLSFNGVDNYVDCGNAPSLDITKAITIEAWVNVRAFVNVYPKIVAKKNQYMLFVDASVKKAVFSLYIDGAFRDLGSITGLSANTWYHIVGQFNSSLTTGQMKIYVNGVLDNTLTKTGTIGSTTNKVLIGNYEGLVRYFNGLITDIRIYNRALTGDEIKRHYESTKSIFR
jgi:hypothetical protein